MRAKLQIWWFGWCYLSFHEASFIQVSKLFQISYFLPRVNGCISLLIWVLTFTFNTGLSSCNCSYSSKLKYIGQFLSRILSTICFYIKKRYTFCFNEPIVWSSMSFDVLHWFIYFYNLWSIIYIISPVAIFCGRFFQYFFKMDNSHGCWGFQTTMTVWPLAWCSFLKVNFI